MPSRQRRREVGDMRSDRFESIIRDNEVASKVLTNRKRLPSCSNCKYTFEEQSKVCPVCDKKTMGYIAPIPDQYKQQAYDNAVRRAQSRTR